MSLSVKMNTVGKFLDQPALLKKINKTVPWVLSGGGLAYGLHDSFSAPKEDRKKRLIQNASILTFTVISAIIATKGLSIGGKKLIKGLVHDEGYHSHEIAKGSEKIANKVNHCCEHHHEHHHEHHEHHHDSHEHGDDIDSLLKKLPKGHLKSIVQEVEDGHILGTKKIKELIDGLNDKGGINQVIPEAHTHNSPFEELIGLSWMGLIPVIGGVTGGVVGDILSKDNWKKKLPDKIKEGSYQYLNNIFLCNVGAGLAMFTMNKMNVQNKAIRATAMLAGVVGVGIIAGSAIANFIGKNFINPIFNKNNKMPKDFDSMVKNLNSERHPEAVDLSLHIDDIASVGFLTGFKWIGPILPMLYSVSAYRAGIGYRNGKEEPSQKAKL